MEKAPLQLVASARIMPRASGPPSVLVERVGPERCIIASDVGMLLEPTALQALRLMVRLLMALGLSSRDIDPMLESNPAKLIGLDAASL